MENPPTVTPKRNEPEVGVISRLPVFPLSVFLLVGGMQRLRIFEPKYTAMVANAAKGDGFVISIDEKKDVFSTARWGTHVKIVDFDMGKDGVLIIDVLAERLVNLTHVESEANGLLTGQVSTLTHWSAETGSQRIEDNGIAYLADTLKAIFAAHSELSFLYKHQYFNYAHWVCARLLEIVPLELDEKAAFIRQLDFTHLTELLSSACEKEMKKK